MSTLLRTALAASFFMFPIGIGTGIIQVEAGDRIVPFSISGQHTARVTGRIRNDSHWLMRRARQGLYDYSSNPLTGPTRYRASNDRGYYDNPEPGALGQSGALRIAGTRYPTGPAAKIITVDGDAVSLAEERAEGRFERFQEQDVEIRFHTARQAYDARFPNVIYLDSR